MKKKKNVCYSVTSIRVCSFITKLLGFFPKKKKKNWTFCYYYFRIIIIIKEKEEEEEGMLLNHFYKSVLICYQLIGLFPNFYRVCSFVTNLLGFFPLK